jgi:hypothetical protein
MMSHCSYCGYLDLTEQAFFQDTVALLVLVVPAALCLILWRIFVTNRSGPRGGVVVLGLDDSSSIYSDLSPNGVPIYLRLVYCAISILTFLIGVMAYQAFMFLSEEYFDYW